VNIGVFPEEGSILAFASALIENKIPAGNPPLPENMFFSNLKTTSEQVEFNTLLTPMPLIYSEIGRLCNCFTPPLIRDLRFGSGIKYQTIVDGFNIYTSSGSGLFWTGTSKPVSAVDISSNGQYQAAVGSGVYFSTDFGKNWASRNINLQLFDISISDSGLYQTAVGVSGSDIPFTASFNLYRSINSGIEWTKPINGISGFRAIAMSSNGQYQITYNSTGIYTSNTYGSSWELKLQNSLIQDLDISTNGQYQTFITFKEIFNSIDYGNTWTSINNYIPLPFAQYNSSVFDVNSFAFDKIRISRKDPKYRAISMLYGKVIYSISSGTSWLPLRFNNIGPLVQSPPLDSRISANWSQLEIY
jgi:hypothetical protein